MYADWQAQVEKIYSVRSQKGRRTRDVGKQLPVGCKLTTVAVAMPGDRAIVTPDHSEARIRVLLHKTYMVFQLH